MLEELGWQDFAELFVLPPANLVFLFVAGALLGRWWPRLGWGLIAGAASALYLLSTPYVSTSLEAALEGPIPALDLEALRGAPATAIVVLAGDRHRDAAEYGGDTVGGSTLERLRWGARIYRATGLPVLVSGGSPERSGPHAGPLSAAMKDAFERDFSVPVRWTEERSRTTWENALYSAEMLRRDGIAKAILVTHAWHMPRALRVFRDTGLDVVAASTLATAPRRLEPAALIPRIRSLQRSYDTLHELVGLAWYRVLPRPVPRRP
jgi:uncharacterized SAM-binding protein YcdF (DUF218 family)